VIVEGEQGEARPARTAAGLPAPALLVFGISGLPNALNRDKIYAHVKTKDDRTTFPSFCHYLRGLYPSESRFATVFDNLSHTSRRRNTPGWATGRPPTTSNWRQLNEPHPGSFQALRYLTLNGTDHHSHEEQSSTIRRYKAAAGVGLPELPIEMGWRARCVAFYIRIGRLSDGLLRLHSDTGRWSIGALTNCPQKTFSGLGAPRFRTA
jgi:hypothetical protein